MGLDVQLLSRWFHKGYSSREMATFLLLADQAKSELKLKNPETLAEKWEQLHEEVVRLVYKK